MILFFSTSHLEEGFNLKDFFTSKGFKILLATIFIAGGLSIISFQYSDNAVKSVWSAICAPIQKITTSVADFAGKLFEDSKSVDEYESEINKLKSEIETLRGQLVNYTKLENENKKYVVRCLNGKKVIIDSEINSFTLVMYFDSFADRNKNH